MERISTKFSLLDVINQLPAMIYLMDMNSTFAHASQVTAKWCGYNNVHNLIGTTYYNIRCKAVEHADYFAEEDRKVINAKKPLKIIGYYCYANEDWKLLLGDKSPVVNKANEVVGCASHFQEVTDYNLIKLSTLLIKADTEHALSKKTKQIRYIIDESYLDVRLSEREAECLFFLLRGKSAKEIAGILKISNKTVEGYIAQIKVKQNCHSKSDLVDKAIGQGLMGIIPSSVFSKNLLCLL